MRKTRRSQPPDCFSLHHAMKGPRPRLRPRVLLLMVGASLSAALLDEGEMQEPAGAFCYHSPKRLGSLNGKGLVMIEVSISWWKARPG